MLLSCNLKLTKVCVFKKNIETACRTERFVKITFGSLSCIATGPLLTRLMCTSVTFKSRLRYM